MTKALRSFPEPLRKKVAERRLKESKRGLGFWAAVDYMAKKRGKAYVLSLIGKRL